jgi:hypothetical protein
MLRSLLVVTGIVVALTRAAPPKRVGTIEGHVFDELNGKPIASANVLILNAGRSVTTDETGKYRLDSVVANEPSSFPEADTVIYARARRIGYFAENRPVLLRNGAVERLDFRMRRDPRPVY